jgi:hypothetical protein
VDGIGIPASEKPAQYRTHAPQQTASLFDHLVGAGKQPGRHSAGSNPILESFLQIENMTGSEPWMPITRYLDPKPSIKL